MEAHANEDAGLEAIDGVPELRTDGTWIPHDGAFRLDVHVHARAAESRQAVRLLADDVLRHGVDGRGVLDDGTEPALPRAQSKHVPGVCLESIPRGVGGEHVRTFQYPRGAVALVLPGAGESPIVRVYFFCSRREAQKVVLVYIFRSIVCRLAERTYFHSVHLT